MPLDVSKYIDSKKYRKVKINKKLHKAMFCFIVPVLYLLSIILFVPGLILLFSFLFEFCMETIATHSIALDVVFLSICMAYTLPFIILHVLLCKVRYFRKNKKFHKIIKIREKRELEKQQKLEEAKRKRERRKAEEKEFTQNDNDGCTAGCGCVCLAIIIIAFIVFLFTHCPWWAAVIILLLLFH